MKVSPYLVAIQSLPGQTPGDKYKELHAIAARIIADDREREEFARTGSSDRVEGPMLPRLRILVGNKLRSPEAVVEALKSEDISIVRQALNAKWFYTSSNDLVSPEYFAAEVVPYVSLRTRLELLKTLARRLAGDAQRADDLFEKYAELFGEEKALPLIVACSQDYIYRVVLRSRLSLPSRLLGILYRRYPELVIRYLQLGNESNEANLEDRKLHRISLSSYSGFLPTLVKHHTQEFVQLFECSPVYTRSTRLGSTRAEFFLRNATDVLIKKPLIFLNILPLKLVSNKLSTQQFESMFHNLLPKDVKDFSIYKIIHYLQYYPQEKKFGLLTSKYKLLYGEELLGNSDIFDCEEFYKLLPADTKEEYARKYLESSGDRAEPCSSYIGRLPPRESIRLIKERMRVPSDVPRSDWIDLLVKSCAIYDSKDDLLDVLGYYYSQHMNEQAYVLHVFLANLTAAFDIRALARAHWHVLGQILQRAYARGDLFATSYDYAAFFGAALHHHLKQNKLDATPENTCSLDFLVKLIVECYVEHDMRWNFVTDCPDLQRVCLQKFLTAIPDKYPQSAEIWTKRRLKLALTSYLVESMHDYNVKHLVSVKSNNKRYDPSAIDSDGREAKRINFSLKDYPWLASFASDLIEREARALGSSPGFKKFRVLLRKHDHEFYQGLIDADPDLINDVDSPDAIVALKRDHRQVLAKWELYLKACKDKLETGSKFARKFLLSTRWYDGIPIKFVSRCCHELDDEGSILVLGTLLEGEAFGNILEPCLPRDDPTVELDAEDAKNQYDRVACMIKAMNLTNPPVSLDVAASFCKRDYAALAGNALTSIGRRVPVDRVLGFASQLLDERHVSVKKIGMRMAFQVACNRDVGEFLKRVWETERNLSIRELVANKIFDLFKKVPTEDTWRLIQACLRGIGTDDARVLQTFLDLRGVGASFAAPYVVELLDKIGALPAEEFDGRRKEQALRTLVGNMDEGVVALLPEHLVTDIVRRNFFDYSTTFTVNTYLLSDPGKFEARLKVIIEILSDEIHKFYVFSPKYPRYYPSNHHVHSFVLSMLKQLLDRRADADDMGQRAIDAVLKLFKTILHPQDDAQIYIALTVYKCYFGAGGRPEEFGRLFGRRLGPLVREYGSEIVVSDVVKVTSEFLSQPSVYKDTKKLDLKLAVMRGLIEADEHNGALVGIKLVDPYEISHYGDLYDELVRAWADIDDPTVRTVLNGLRCQKVYYP